MSLAFGFMIARQTGGSCEGRGKNLLDDAGAGFARTGVGDTRATGVSFWPMHNAPHRLFRGAGAENRHVCRPCHLPDAAEVGACNFGAAAPPLRRLHRLRNSAFPAFVRTAEELARGATELHVDQLTDARAGRWITESLPAA